MSLAMLGTATFVSRGWINNVEAGRRWPARSWAAQADVVLQADGALVRTWEAGQRERENSEGVASLLVASARDSNALVATHVHERDLDSLQDVVEQLAIGYLASPARPMLEQGMDVRRELTMRAKVGAIRPRELADLYLGLGRVSGILSYAALDLGRSDIARTHIETAWHMADLTEDNELKAWVRGTQSLIARFDQKWDSATSFIEDGLRYAGQGSSILRLLSGAAQCAANMGDTAHAIEYLDTAERARETIGPDSLEGLFGFSRAKQWYYGGSSLMWLPERFALERAEKSAEAAIAAWEHEPPEQRSLDDEALAHVYLATARIRLHDLDGAMDAVRPILELPPERQISWISKRVSNLAALLEDEAFNGSRQAADAREELRAYGS
jgi:tetratricopeptide (TPR) repeat protein